MLMVQTSDDIRVIVTPDSNDVIGVRNQVLRLDTQTYQSHQM